eukprot:RCo045984
MTPIGVLVGRRAAEKCMEKIGYSQFEPTITTTSNASHSSCNLLPILRIIIGLGHTRTRSTERGQKRIKNQNRRKGEKETRALRGGVGSRLRTAEEEHRNKSEKMI